MKSRTLVIMLDADGCFYNKKFEQTLLYIIYRYGDKIKKIHDQGLVAQPDNPQLLHELNVEFDEIHQRVQKYQPHRYQYDQLMIDIRDRFFPQLHIFPEDWNQRLTKLSLEYISYLDEMDRTFLDDVLFRSNKRLLEKIQRSVTENKIDKIIFMVGSNRQSMSLDLFNMHSKGTRSFFLDLQALTEHVKQLFVNEGKPDVLLDYFLMADVHNDAEAGESYQRILAELKEVSFKKQFETIFDATKFSTIYAFLHYLALTYRSEYESNQLFVEYFDDARHILKAINDSVNGTNNLDLLPRNLVLNMHHYDGKKIHDDDKIVIRGSGDVDVHYRTNVKKMVEMCKCSHLGGKIDVANQLDFKKYKRKIQGLECHVATLFRPFRLLTLRDRKDEDKQHQQSHTHVI